MSKSIYGRSSVNLTIDNLSFLSITTNDIVTTNASVTAVIDFNTGNASTINVSDLNVSNITIDEISVETLNVSNANVSISNVSTENVSQINVSNVSAKKITATGKIEAGSDIKSAGSINCSNALTSTGLIVSLDTTIPTLPATITGGLNLFENANGNNALNIDGTMNCSNASIDNCSVDILSFNEIDGNVIDIGTLNSSTINASTINVSDNVIAGGNVSGVNSSFTNCSLVHLTSNDAIIGELGSTNIYITNASIGTTNTSTLNASTLSTTGIATIGGNLTCNSNINVNGGAANFPLTYFKQSGVEGGQTNYEYQSAQGKYVMIDVFNTDDTFRIFDSDNSRRFSFFTGSKFSINTNVSSHNINCSTGLITTLDTNTLNASNINVSTITADDYVIVNENISTLNASTINVDIINISSLNVSSNTSYAEITGSLKLFDIGQPNSYGIIMDTNNGVDTNIVFNKNGSYRFGFDCLNSGTQNGFRLQNKQLPSQYEVDNIFLINGSGNDLGFHISSIDDFIENCSTSFHNKVGFDDNIILHTNSTGSIYTDFVSRNGTVIPPERTFFRAGMEYAPQYLYTIKNSSNGDEANLTTTFAINGSTGNITMENDLWVKGDLNVSSNTYVSGILNCNNVLRGNINNPTFTNPSILAQSPASSSRDAVVNIRSARNTATYPASFLYFSNYDDNVASYEGCLGAVAGSVDNASDNIGHISLFSCSNGSSSSIQEEVSVYEKLTRIHNVLECDDMRTSNGLQYGNLNRFMLGGFHYPSNNWGQGNHIIRQNTNCSCSYSQVLQFTYDATNNGFKLNNSLYYGVYRIKAKVGFYNGTGARQTPYIGIAVNDDTNTGNNPDFIQDYNGGENPFAGGYTRYTEGKRLMLNAERTIRIVNTTQLISVNTYVASGTSNTLSNAIAGGGTSYAIDYASLSFEYLGDYTFTSTTY